MIVGAAVGLAQAGMKGSGSAEHGALGDRVAVGASLGPMKCLKSSGSIRLHCVGPLGTARQSFICPGAKVRTQHVDRFGIPMDSVNFRFRCGETIDHTRGQVELEYVLR